MNPQPLETEIPEAIYRHPETGVICIRHASAARRLGISRQAVSRLVKKGTLKSFTLWPGVQVIPLTELEGGAGRQLKDGRWRPYTPNRERQAIGRRVARQRLANASA